MAIYLKRNALQSRLKALLVTRNLSFAPDRTRHPTTVPTTPTLKDLSSRMAEKCESLAKSEDEKAKKPLVTDLGSHSMPVAGNVDVSKWRKLDSRMLGINRNKISPSSWAVLKILQGEGFDTYLVGGCVRDLLLNKVPKDFDVITTASLKQIKKLFHNCLIVGRRFPICLVSMKGTPIEVSSFETASTHSNRKEELGPSQVPCGCDRKDLARWRNSLHRDFTINSLFYDPFVNKVYDYANGMMDLKSLKLRTLVPAQLSFEEDCARILRGLRIAARLGLSFSKETETAIRKLSSSVTSLAKARLMMEMNYMLSYGAAKPSLSLLWRFSLLEILLPFQAAYLNEHSMKRSCQSSAMLMELFSNLDKFVTCDQPSDSKLWIGLLAFHTALVNKPQDAIVVWTFASVLYHRTWKEAVQFAREHAQAATIFSLEIPEAHTFLSDEELAKRVTQLAHFVQYSIGSLVDKDTLIHSMSRFPGSQGSDLVFISQNAGHSTSRLFNTLVGDIEANNQGRKCFEIDYQLLKKGDFHETSFVLGKVIMDTLNSGVYRAGKAVEEKDYLGSFSSNQKVQRRRNLSPTSVDLVHERAKRQKMIGEMANSPRDDRIEKQTVGDSDAVKKDNVNTKLVEIAHQNQPDKDKEVPKETIVSLASKWINKLLWPQSVMEQRPLSSEQNEEENCNFLEDGSIEKQETVINEEPEKVTKQTRGISENESQEVAKKVKKKKKSECTKADVAAPKSKKKARQVKPHNVTEEGQGNIEPNSCQEVNDARPSSVLESDHDTMKNKGGKKKKREMTENDCRELTKKRQKVQKESDEVAPKSKPVKLDDVMEESQDSILEAVHDATSTSVLQTDQDTKKGKRGTKQKQDLTENECRKVAKKRWESECADPDEEVPPKSKKKARGPAKPRNVTEEKQVIIDPNCCQDFSLEVVNDAPPSSVPASDRDRTKLRDSDDMVISSESNKISKQKRKVSKKNSSSEVAKEISLKKPDGRSQKDQNGSVETATTQMHDSRKSGRRSEIEEGPGTREVKGNSSRRDLANTKKDESDKKCSRTALSSLFR